MAKSVAATLLSLQQELAKPPPVFEPYKALVGLESYPKVPAFFCFVLAYFRAT